jgi:hypothetical protein
MTQGNFDWFLHTMLFYHTGKVLDKQAKKASKSTNDDGSDDDDDEEEEEDIKYLLVAILCESKLTPSGFPLKSDWTM